MSEAFVTTPDLSIVVPLYNEAESLPELVAEITQAMSRVEHVYEVVFVDDGSTDRSLELLRELTLFEPRFRVLHIERNSGQSAALAIGFQAARGRVVVTLDADLQNDPADIPRLLEELGGCDVVSGVRARRQDSWQRRLASWIANRVRDRVVHDGVSDVGCSLKAYRSEFLEGLPAFDGMHRFLPALAAMQGARIREIPVRHRPRTHGESKYTIGGRLWRGLYDLIGVRWLQKRWVDVRLGREIKVWKPRAAGASEDAPSAGSPHDESDRS